MDDQSKSSVKILLTHKPLFIYSYNEVLIKRYRPSRPPECAWRGCICVNCMSQLDALGIHLSREGVKGIRCLAFAPWRLPSYEAWGLSASVGLSPTGLRGTSPDAPIIHLREGGLPLLCSFFGTACLWLDAHKTPVRLTTRKT